MNRSISTAKCIGDTASKARSLVYKTPNAAGKAMNMDPKTIRQIENGGAVRLSTIKSFAEHLLIPLESILDEVDLALLDQSRIVLDYSNDDLFRGTDLAEYGSYRKHLIPCNKLGLPCDSIRFISLFSKMSEEPIEWPPFQKRAIKPIWELHDSITPLVGNLLVTLEKLQVAISESVMSRSSDLTGIISQIKAQSDFNELFDELEECGVHILGCIVQTYVFYEGISGRYIDLPLFVITSTEVREVTVQYQKSFSSADYAACKDIAYGIENAPHLIADPDDFVDEYPF